MMWAADEGHEAAIKLLIDRGADKNAKSNLAQRGGGPALGKSNDPRRAVAAQVAAVEARVGRAGPGQTLRVADGDDAAKPWRPAGAAGRAAVAVAGGGRGGGGARWPRGWRGGRAGGARRGAGADGAARMPTTTRPWRPDSGATPVRLTAAG